MTRQGNRRVDARLTPTTLGPNATGARQGTYTLTMTTWTNGRTTGTAYAVVRPEGTRVTRYPH